MNPVRVLLPLLFVTTVLAHGYGGGYSGYSQNDCGGTCGGGCGYGNPCNSAPIVETSGCDGDCGSSGGGYSRHTSGHSSSHAGYHKSVTSITKETRNDELKIVVGKPVVNVRTTYVQPQPVIRKTTYIQEPAPAPVVYKKHRYVDEGADYSGCGGAPCGGGSKIVKIIKKTTYAADGGSCSTCGSEVYSGDYSGGYSSEYSEPAVVRKVTRIVTQPKVVRVVKTVVDAQPSEEYYEDSGSSYSGHGGGHHQRNHGGYGRQKSYGGASAKAGAFAFASASASAGAGAGSGTGDYSSEKYSGGGCKSGCDQWKK